MPAESLAVGDVLLFHSRDRWYERLIVWATAGGDPRATYVHAEIVVKADDAGGRAESIGALASGITRHAVATDRSGVLVPTSARMSDPARVAAMTRWLDGQVGRPYGWGAILDAGLRWLWPHGWRLTRRGVMDCSVLVATALVLGGYPVPAAIVCDLGSTSPNDLARALEVVNR